MLKMDLDAARAKWIKQAPSSERSRRERSNFLAYWNHAGQVFDFHALRHQFTSSLAAAGVHPKVAQQLARHSTIDLTMNTYTHLQVADVVGAVERLREPAPIAPGHQQAQATGTDGQVADRNLHTGNLAGTHYFAPPRTLSSSGTEGGNGGDSVERQEAQKTLQKHRVSAAEGTGIEPATPFGAPHFQCGR